MFIVWKSKLEIFVHKLLPNWPPSGNSFGSISDSYIMGTSTQSKSRLSNPLFLPIYYLIGTLVVWKCKLEIFVHKLSPNWPRAGNSSGSISDARIISCLDLWLFGKVKVIYKHYQSNFQCTGVLSLYRYRSLSSRATASKPADWLLSLPIRPNSVVHNGNFFVKFSNQVQLSFDFWYLTLMDSQWITLVYSILKLTKIVVKKHSLIVALLKLLWW